MVSKFSDAFGLPMMWTELAVASWETIWRRTALMASGTCSPAEYELMLHEKMNAMQLSGAALMSGAEAEDVLRPFHTGATENARRLRTPK